MELDDTLRSVPLAQVRRDATLALRVVGRIAPTHAEEYQAVRRIVERHVGRLLAIAEAAQRNVNRIPPRSRMYLR